MARLLPCGYTTEDVMSSLSEIKSLARSVIKTACAGETLAGYKCEQRGECATHSALNNAHSKIDFRPIFRDEFTGYCPAFASA